MAGSAQAAAPAAGTCAKLPERDDGTIHVVGCMADTSEKPATPVAGVDITVEDDTGNVDRRPTPATQTGRFDIPLGDTLDVLGKDFVVKIDKDSLPEGAELRNPDQLELDGEHQPRGRHLDHVPDRRGRRLHRQGAPRRCSCSSAASSSRCSWPWRRSACR